MNCEIVHRLAQIDMRAARGAKPGADWLTCAEQNELKHWRDERRRAAWLVGRRIAKCLLVDELQQGNDLLQIEILSLDKTCRSVRPRVRIRGVRWNGSLSISHSENAILVAMMPSCEFNVGCDLQRCGTATESLAEFWFAPRELRWLRAQDDQHAATTIWAAKEAWYKACNHGEPFSPTSFRITPGFDRLRCCYRGEDVKGCCTVRWESFAGHRYALAFARAARVPDSVGTI